MENIKRFVNSIQAINWPEGQQEQIIASRKVISEINRFLFATYDGIGEIDSLGNRYPFFSEFHRFWERHYQDVLGITINESSCESVADALHDIYIKTGGRVFTELYDVCGLQIEDVCQIRILTANQDFRGSRKFEDLARTYKNNPTIFECENIYNDPDAFLSALGMTKLSQNDKRRQFAQKFAAFVMEHGGSPYRLIDSFGRNISLLRNAMINCVGAGYGNKKTDMVLRDMVVQRVWQNVRGFDALDVASDINTIGIALRTGILRAAIPLVSSFLDQFCCQYGYIDEMNAKAWRCVWEKWCERYPNEKLSSPCLLDYFIYNVVGKQFCKLGCILQCDRNQEHVFRVLSARKKKCTVRGCGGRLNEVNRILPCDDEHGDEFIRQTAFMQTDYAPADMKECPFKPICDNYAHKRLQPPKSISILGQTGWTSAYAVEGDGGGGLMA